MARKEIKVEVELIYLPFPNEQKRIEAYRTHAKLFLKAKEKELKRE